MTTPAEATDARLRDAYDAYSTQDVDRLLSHVAEEVDWPDGDRRLHGRAAVRAYWVEQWTRLRTVDRPVVVAPLSDEVVTVRIDQTVRSLTGAVVSRGAFVHVLHLDGALIARLDIVPLRPSRSTETEEPTR